MSSSKLRKISKIVKEITMQSSQSRYDISGLDLSLCKFYYRTPQNLFKDLASGDYTIDTSSGQQSLVIQNDTVLQTGEAIQVCYNMDLTSSKYVVDFEIDINKLTTSYNELVEDVHTLWEYIRKTGMIADDTTIDLILPQLNNNEVWVKSEDGYVGMPLDDVESSIKDIIDKYSQQKIEEIKREVTTHVDSEIQRATNEITDVKDTSIQNIKDQEKTSTNNMISEINKHTEKKKVELNDHEQLKEQELNDLHEQLSTRLQELIDGAVMDKGVLPINSDWHLLDRGNYYVIDLFNSNYKNHPINIVNQNEGQGIVMVGIADDGKTKIIRYYSTSKRMFFQVLTQSNVWSEWAVVGGGNGTVYEIVQNNHGFNFNAVSLDGLTSRWVLADKNTGADAVAIKIDDNKFQLLLNGQGVIPTSSRDDKGNEFIYDEYYFLSNTVNGAFQKDKPTYGLFQPLFHTRMVENKLVADVQIGDIHDLTQHIVDSETMKEYGIATEKDLLNKLDKGNVSSNYDTAEKIEYQIKKLQANTIEDLIAMNFLKVGDIVEVLGYYSAGDGAGHKRIIASEDDGSGVQLSNNLWANIVHNGEVNVSWFGDKVISNIQKALNIADTVIFDKKLVLNIASENDTLKPKSYQKIIFKPCASIEWGQTKAPYYPLFLFKDVKFCELDGFTSIWNGELNWGNFGHSGENIEYEIKSLARNFCTVIGLFNAENIKIKNSKGLSVMDKTYDAFIRNLGGSSNIVIDNIFVTNYNNAFSDGFINSTLSNIVGVKRSNKVGQNSGVAYYGPSHLIYSGAFNTVITNIKEVGTSMEDGEQGGATIQLVSPKNTTITNVLTKMKNTPSLYIKGDSIDNVVINNIICDCFDWSDINVESVIGFSTYPKAKNVIMDNIIVKTYNNDITALRIGGNNSTFSNIVVEAEVNKQNLNPLVFLNGAYNCNFDIKIKNLGDSESCFMYMSKTKGNNIKLDCLGKGYLKSGNHPKNNQTWGINLENDIILVTQKNMPPLQIKDLNYDEQKLNCITKDKIINNQLSYKLSSPSTNISKEFALHKNGSFLLNITIRQGINHAQNILGILLIENGTNKFLNFAEITNIKKGSGRNYNTIITPKIENDVPSVLIESSCPSANIDQIEFFYIDMCNF